MIRAEIYADVAVAIGVVKMSHDEEFRDSSGKGFGVLAVVVFVAVPILPAVLSWIKFFTN
jgi:hypothetical protein